MGDQDRRCLRTVGLTVVDDHAGRPQVMAAGRGAVPVLGLPLAVVGDGDVVKTGGCLWVEGCRVRGVKVHIKRLPAWCAGGQDPLVLRGYRADLGDLEGLVSTSAQGGWCRPLVDGDRPVAGRGVREELGQPLWCEAPLAVIELGPGRFVRMASPPGQAVWAPRCRLARLEGRLRVADRDARRVEAGCQGRECDGFPSPAVHGLVGLSSTGRALNQMGRPDITSVGRIIELGELITVRTVMSQQCSSETEETFRLHLGASTTRQERSSGLIDCRNRTRPRSSQPLQTALVTDIEHQEPVDAIDRFGF